MKTTPPASPDAYVAALDGWRRECVESLRAAVALNQTLGDPTLAAKRPFAIEGT